MEPISDRNKATRIQTNFPNAPWFGLPTMDTTVMIKMIRPMRPLTPPIVKVMGSMSREYQAVNRLIGLAAVAMLCTVSMTACTPAAPTPAASDVASPTPTETSEPVNDALIPTVLVVSGSSIEVHAQDDTVLATIPFTMAGADAAAQLSDAIGNEPKHTHNPDTGTGCGGEFDFYDWGGISIQSPGVITTAPGNKFSVSVDAASTEGLQVDTLGGQHVGSTVAEVQDAIPDAVYNDWGGGLGSFFIDTQNPGDPEGERWGLDAQVDSGSVTRLDTPIFYQGDC
jgi:hypothetical protein